MKPKNTFNPLLSTVAGLALTAATGIAVLSSGANAASLTHIGWDFLHSQNHGGNSHDISLFAGSAGYSGNGESGTTSGTFGDGTVEAYNFFSANAGVDATWNTGDETIVSYASAGTSITGSVSAGTMIQGTNNAADIWTTTNPAGFTSTADYTNPTGVSGMSHVSFLAAENPASTYPVWSGTIDISSYASGSIYFMYGSYRGGPGAVQDLDLTMRDSDMIVSDIQLLNAGSNDQPNNWQQYVVEIGFVNDEGYDSIDYALAFSVAGSNTPNGRIEGIVLNGITIPEPSTALLGGLGLLALLRRRR